MSNENTTTAIPNITNSTTVARIGIQGIRLKKFEEVVCDCLNSGIRPNYFPLPQLSNGERKALIEKGVQLSPYHWSSTCSEESDENLNDHNETKQKIPPLPWPFNILHPAVGVREIIHSNHNNMLQNSIQTLGKLSGMRAARKEWQLCSMIQCLLAILPAQALGSKDVNSSSNDGDRIKIVDFAGGTGHLALPLALLLPKCEIILVDLKATSLELVHEKAKDLTTSTIMVPESQENMETVSVNHTGKNEDDNINYDATIKKKKKKKRPKPTGASRDIDVTCHSNTLRQCKHLTNLYTFHGSISSYAENNDFDIGLSLHCCGEGTDLVLRACGEANAHFVVSPCCVGKLSSQKNNPYIYHATAKNEATVSYPQSSSFCQIIPNRDKFDSLAKAADYSDIDEMRSNRNATRRTAKALLESDRLFFMKERYGYDEVVLTRMSPWEASPKNDILLGWFNKNRKCLRGPYNDGGGTENVVPCVDCNADIGLAVSKLILPESSERTEGLPTLKDSSSDAVDWSKDEFDEVTYILQQFKQSDSSLKRFPTRMGTRKRKLVHFIAEKMNLLHWSEGKKVSNKIVVIAKQRKDGSQS